MLDLPFSGTAEFWINSSNWKLGSSIFLDNCHLSKITDSWGNFWKVFACTWWLNGVSWISQRKNLSSFSAFARQRALLEVIQSVHLEAKNPTSFHCLKATSNLFCCCFSSYRSLPLLPVPDSAAKPKAVFVLCGCCLKTNDPWRTGGVWFLWFEGVLNSYSWQRAYHAKSVVQVTCVYYFKVAQINNKNANKK